MENPWDPPVAHPKKFNYSRRKVYQAVGHALSQWEELEARWSFLYLRLTGAEFSNAPEIAFKPYKAAFGVGGRLSKLDEAATQYFIAACDQEFEAEFCTLLTQAKSFTPRRNDIAHGVVRQLNRNIMLNDVYVHEQCGFCVMPISMPHQYVGPRPQKEINIYMPDEIEGYANAFMLLRFRFENFIIRMKIIEIEPSLR